MSYKLTTIREHLLAKAMKAIYTIKEVLDDLYVCEIEEEEFLKELDQASKDLEEVHKKLRLLNGRFTK